MSSSRSRLGAFLLLAGTFLVGLVAGVVLDRFSLIRERRLVPRHGPFMTERVVRRLDRELDLSPQQEAQVRSILERRRASVQKVWSESQPRVSAEMKQASDEIASVLTPAQRPKFEAMSERWRRFGERMEKQRSDR